MPFETNAPRPALTATQTRPIFLFAKPRHIALCFQALVVWDARSDGGGTGKSAHLGECPSAVYLSAFIVKCRGPVS